MNDAETVTVLRNLIDAAIADGPREEDLKLALDYFHTRIRGDEMDGRSQVQSSDVRDMVHAVMAQILPSFTQDTVCQFEPDGQDDDIAARMESDACNKVIMEDNRGFLLFTEAIADALTIKNGIVKGYLDETPERGRRICLETVDPTNFIVSGEQRSVLLDPYGTTFCAERKEYSRGALVEMGIERSLIETVPSGDEGNITAGARNRQNIRKTPAEAGWANEVVTVWECYAHLPDDKDSAKTKLYRCLIGGQTLLLKERADALPYAAGTGVVEPHRFWGMSYFDLLKAVQDTKTSIKRQWLDNLSNCNNSREAINDRVNIDDALTSRPGGKVRIQGSGPVQDAVMPLPSLDVGPAAMSFLQYEDQVRADRGGAALQMASAESQLMGSQVGSMGVDRIFSVQEAISGKVARTLAETLLRSVFMLVHRLLRTEYKQPLNLRMADQWVQVDPSQWRHRDRVNIKSGLSPGERSRKAAAMTQVLGMQTQALQMGLDGVMVNQDNLYNAYLDWASANELEAGEKYFTNPKSQTAQAASQSKMQQNGQQQQIQAQLAQIPLLVEQLKAQQARYEADLDARTKLQIAALQAEVEEAKIVGGATADLQLEELRARTAAIQGAQDANGSEAGPGRAAA